MAKGRKAKDTVSVEVSATKEKMEVKPILSFNIWDSVGVEEKTANERLIQAVQTLISYRRGPITRKKFAQAEVKIAKDIAARDQMIAFGMDKAAPEPFANLCKSFTLEYPTEIIISEAEFFAEDEEETEEATEQQEEKPEPKNGKGKKNGK